MPCGQIKLVNQNVQHFNSCTNQAKIVQTQTAQRKSTNCTRITCDVGYQIIFVSLLQTVRITSTPQPEKKEEDE